MSTETIIKVGGITQGPPISLIGGEDFIGGGSGNIEGAGAGITRDIKGL